MKFTKVDCWPGRKSWIELNDAIAGLKMDAIICVRTDENLRNVRNVAFQAASRNDIHIQTTKHGGALYIQRID